MKTHGKNPNTGDEYEVDVQVVDAEFVKSMSDFYMTEEDVKRFIDNLNVSADTKALLYKFTQSTIRAGKFILRIGRKIIDFIMILHREFPNATFGMLFGAIAGFLVGTIPVIGAALGAVFTPIAIAIGLVGGLAQDIKDKELARRIAEVNAGFSPLGA